MGTDDTRALAADPTIKQLLDRGSDALDQVVDPFTAAQLAKWFELPAQEDPPIVVDDLDDIASRERRARALAAIDPALVEAHRRRVEGPAVVQLSPTIELHVDPTITRVDTRLMERQHAIAEPREVEIPGQLDDDLRECTPQAVLRDLHRPELYFDKQFEMTDPLVEARVDGRSMAAQTMATAWRLPAANPTPARELRALRDELRALHRHSWAAVVDAGQLPNRRVSG